MKGFNGDTLTADDRQAIENLKTRLRSYALSVLNWRRENTALARACDVFRDRFSHPVLSESIHQEIFRVPGMSYRESQDLVALNAPFIRDMLDRQHSAMLAGWLARCYETGVVTDVDLEGVAALFAKTGASL